MYTLLSPAKKQSFSTTVPAALTVSHIPFPTHTKTLIETLREYSPSALRELMKLSVALAELNVDRYWAYETETDTPENSHPALWAFQGDVYRSFAVDTLPTHSWPFTQDHLLSLIHI